MKKLLCAMCAFLISYITQASLVEYEFDINTINVNFTGKNITALSVGGQIPGPTIRATVGDTLKVTFHNKMDVESSIHWHGILLPNEQDGVPYLTTQPIAPHSSHTFEYPIIHSGTYWYHSHTGLQEQRGVYGSIVFSPLESLQPSTDADHVIVLSDWTDENPHQVMANIKKDGDYYALKKDSVQSWDKVIANGIPAIKNRLGGSWTKMGPMDLSDVGYDAFLANGKKESIMEASAGDKIRLRIINAGASSYFYLQYAGGPMTIVAADGIDVKPIKVNKLRIAIAETYDVIIDVPDEKMFEFRNSSEDGTGFASTYIGNGEKVFAPTIDTPNPFLVDHSMHDMSNMSGMDHSTMDHSKMGHDMPKDVDNIIDSFENYASLEALSTTSLPKSRLLKTVDLQLTGNMERYVWSFNNKTLSEADKILIRKGENVRFILTNTTMMHHPIHLHGHFFRVLNGKGDYSPLKHTVNVPPMGSVTIEFSADEEKDWFFHCHNLYHMMAGMARVVSYEESTRADEKILQKLWHDRDWYYATDLTAYNNMTMGHFKASNSRNAIKIEYDNNYTKQYDVDITYDRSINRFFEIFAGINFERESSDEVHKNIGVAGFHYVLPMLIDSSWKINTKSIIKLTLESELQLTSRTKLEWDWNIKYDYKEPGLKTQRDYMFLISYEFNKKIMFSAIYDSNERYGAGIRIKL